MAHVATGVLYAAATIRMTATTHNDIQCTTSAQNGLLFENPRLYGFIGWCLINNECIRKVYIKLQISYGKLSGLVQETPYRLSLN